jgi:hypothetical protein
VLYYNVGQEPELLDRGFSSAQELVTAGKILVPRGRPHKARAASFYKEIAESYREFAAAGLSPVKEIARRKHVPKNTVHQWIYRARQLKFLEPSPRSKREIKEDKGG